MKVERTANTDKISHEYCQFGHVLLEKEQRIKLEIAIVSTLWLVGCPLLCLLVDSDASLYGTKTDELCGLIQYSISSSMTGHYSKVLGSVMTPIFAVLVVQRTSGGLCSHIKLLILSRYSPLAMAGCNEQEDEKDMLEAKRLWNHVVKIELLGYFAGASLIALVAFDSKNFELLHLLLASFAFLFLGQQNRLIGHLGEYYPSIFVDWYNKGAVAMFYWGFIHLAIMYAGFFFLGTLNDRGHCDVVGRFLGPDSQPSVAKIASALFWANEYAFAFLCISLQLLKYYEYRIWQIVGEENMPYSSILSKWSTFSAFDRFVSGESKEADVLFSVSNASRSILREKSQ